MPTGGARCTSQGILPRPQSFWLRDAMSSDLALILWELITDHSKDFPVRQYTLAHSVYQLENVANLDRVPDEGGMVVVAPSMLRNASVGPVRVLALMR